ncbi:MAG TPA: alginate lyase family protein [Microbacteriaceae bacterium]
MLTTIERPRRSQRRWLVRTSALALTTALSLLVVPGMASASPPAQPPAASHHRCAGPISHGFCAPKTVVLDGQRMLNTRNELRAGDPRLRAQLDTLLTQADAALTAGPWSVTSKDLVPPSGDKRDYVSEAPYWWPTQPQTADNPYGCPYVQRDGQRYPGADAIQDHNDRGVAFDAIYKLALAWYYTGEPQYAQRATLDLRTWFLDSKTGMNPNLDFTQFIPCTVDGRGIGIIDFSEALPDVIDAVAVLDSGAPGWTDKDHAGMTSWFSQFLEWLQTSQNGREEKAAENNHGSFFDEQEAALALYIGQPELAKNIVLPAATSRLDVQIAGDGSQPLELSRTRSWHYSMFNLMALTRLADVGNHVGVNLWEYTTPNGGSLAKAVDFVIPAATGALDWPYPETLFQQFRMLDVIHAAADAGDRSAIAALPLIPLPPKNGDIWQLRPAADFLS